MIRRNRWLALGASLPTLLSCGEKATTSADPFPGGEMDILFSGQVGGEAFVCGKAYENIGSSDTTAMAQDLRFYVSDVRLITESGEEVPVTLATKDPWQSDAVALLDFENGTGPCETAGNGPMNDRISLTAPTGSYVGVVFSLAVPEALNHEDPTQAPAPLQVSAMQWNWLLGYKFLRAEMRPMHDPGEAGFGVGGMGGMGGSGYGGASGTAASHGQDSQFHLGSLGCTSTGSATAPPSGTCQRPNRSELRFENFNPQSQLIVADLAQMMKGVDLLGSNHCHGMAAASCAPFYASVGLDYETGGRQHDQTAFRVEARPSR